MMKRIRKVGMEYEVPGLLPHAERSVSLCVTVMASFPSMHGRGSDTPLLRYMVKATRRTAYGFRDNPYFFSQIYGNSRKPSQIWLSHTILI